MTSPLQENEAVRRLHAQYAVARALAESSSLAEAAPRILRAICEPLGWEHGGLWRVDADAGVLRCVETWQTPGLAFPGFEEASRRLAFAPGEGLPGRVWESRRPAFIPDVAADDNFPRARGREPGGPARRPGHPHPSRRAGPRRAGVLQPRDRPARRGAARDAGHGRKPDRPVRRAQARGSGARDALRDVARHALHRRSRRHLPPAEPGLGEDTRLHRRRADVAALRRVRPPGRPGPDRGRGGQQREWRRLRPLREPVPVQGRLLPLAGLEIDAAPRRGPHLRDGARRDRAEARRGGAAAARGRRPSRPAGRRATSSPT